MNVDYQGLVERYLSENFSKPPGYKEKDFQVGLEQITKLAVSLIKKIESSDQGAYSTLNREKVSEERKAIQKITEKIEEFLGKHKFQFQKACSIGFPFSMLESATSEKVLEKAVKSYDSIIIHLLNQDDSAWLTVEELEKKFGEVFRQINMRAIGDACSELKLAYIRYGEKRAGYHLLLLIKYLAGCNFEIPSKDTFDESTVKNVLNTFIYDKSGTLKHPKNFLELLHYKRSRLESAMHQDFLDAACSFGFFFFTVNLLQSIPMADWPNKGSIIIALLETVTYDERKNIAEALEASKDLVTSEVGQHISYALNATVMKACIPHFYALKELLPNLNYSQVETIFARPFNSFRCDKSFYGTDPDFTRRLNFNYIRKVFVSGDLMIGTYRMRTTSKGRAMPPHLLAYDMKTEKMKWGVPLSSVSIKDLSINSAQAPIIHGMHRFGPGSYSLNRVGKDIAVQFLDQKTAYIIESSSGEIKTQITLQYKKKSEYDRLHLTPDGFGYQMVTLKRSRTLIGGKISHSKLNPAFEIKTPRGFFRPLSTHVGFFEGIKKKLVLFGPAGKSVTLDVLSAKAYGNKLYLIEPDPVYKNACRLAIRTLIADDRVVSAPEKTIELKGKRASVGCLCNNEQMVLFAYNGSPIFVNLDSEEIVYSKHQVCPYSEDLIINTYTGEVWSWHQTSSEIWKISPKEAVLMGSLNSGCGTNLVHVDESDHLYFTDIPY